MKKLLLLITVIMAMLLAGCAPETVYIEKDDDDSKSSSSSKDYSDEYDNQSSQNGNNSDNEGRNSEKSNDPVVGDAIEGEATDEDDDSSATLLPGEVKLPNALLMELPQMGSFKIRSYIISERYGDKIITLRGDFTNLQSEYDWSLSNLRGYFDAYQDDIRLNTTGHDNDVDLYTDIKPNKTIEACCSYILRTETDDVEIIGTDYNDVEYVVTFPIK